MEDWLTGFLNTVGGVAGTVHVREQDNLRLVACQNIPEPVQRIIGLVPRGKGMAGLALERGVPVQTCNLKEDTSGDVRPGAKAVDAGAAVAVPVRSSDGTIAAVVGAAFAENREIGSEELMRIAQAASSLPGR